MCDMIDNNQVMLMLLTVIIIKFILAPLIRILNWYSNSYINFVLFFIPRSTQTGYAWWHWQTHINWKLQTRFQSRWTFKFLTRLTEETMLWLVSQTVNVSFPQSKKRLETISLTSCSFSPGYWINFFSSIKAYPCFCIFLFYLFSLVEEVHYLNLKI